MTDERSKSTPSTVPGFIAPVTIDVPCSARLGRLMSGHMARALQGRETVADDIQLKAAGQVLRSIEYEMW